MILKEIALLVFGTLGKLQYNIVHNCSTIQYITMSCYNAAVYIVKLPTCENGSLEMYNDLIISLATLTSTC